MKTILISKHIHCGFASFQTGDEFATIISSDKKLDFKPVANATIVSKKFPMLNGEVISEISCDKQFMAIYLKSDETFYERCLRERRGIFSESFAKTPEFKTHIDSYKAKGWLFKVECKEQDDYRNRRELLRQKKAKAEGYVLWMGYDNYKGHPEYFQGGFSEAVFNSPSLKKYVGDGSFVHGYIGHSVRKPELDKVIEKGLRKRGLSDEAMYNWLSSGDGRHFGDSLEGYKLSEQKTKIKKYLNSMFNLCLIFGSQNHEGTKTSSDQIRADYQKQGILLPEDKSAYDQNGYMKLMAVMFAASAKMQGKKLPAHLEKMLPGLIEDVKGKTNNK